MAILFKDFLPTQTKSGFFSNEYEALGATVARANEWISESGANVINVETVLLPNTDNEEKTAMSGLRTSGEMSSWWFQVVRVWYDVPNPPQAGAAS